MSDVLRTLEDFTRETAARQAVIKCKADILNAIERHSPEARAQALWELAAVVGGPETLDERLKRIDVELIELWRSIAFLSTRARNVP